MPKEGALRFTVLLQAHVAKNRLHKEVTTVNTNSAKCVMPLGLSDSDSAIIAILLLVLLSYCVEKAQLRYCACTKVNQHMAKMADGSTSTEEELLPLEGAKNTGIWQYFGFPARNGQFAEPDKRKRKSSRCKLCHLSMPSALLDTS